MIDAFINNNNKLSSLLIINLIFLKKTIMKQES